MTQKDKELLLKDLCARLIYGIIVNVNGNNEKVDEINPFEEIITCGFQSFDIMECKPYLRSMSSITEEEKEEFEQIRYSAEAKLFNAFSKGGFTLAFHEIDDWLNAHHFDYRGLIPMGLALEAPEGMYSIK